MLVQTLFWIALPGVCYGLLAAWLLPAEPRHRWRARLHRAASPPRRRRAVAAPGRRRRTSPVLDPFVVLAVQVRLGVVAAQLRALEDDPHVWARARRLEATRAAYDDLLAEACRLAGVPAPDDVTDRRLTAEMELASRGWSW